jgi:SAM-dependent methyltransferase
MSFAPFIKGCVLLDIGAGAGFAAEEAIARGFAVRACEPSPQCCKEFLDRNGFEPESTFFDSEYAEKNRHQIDVVLLSHVFEHVPEPEQILNNVSLVLRPGGVVIIAVPLFGSVLTAVMGKKDFFITPPEHLTYFSHAGLIGLLKRYGYHVESMYTSSKVNVLRYRNQLGPACYAVNVAAYSVLKLAELINRSVVLNVCARRV